MASPRPRVPITRVHLGEEEIDAAAAVLRSGNIRQGAICQEFEAAFAAAVGAAEAVAVSSGTAALHLAWLALLEPGSEVVVPAFTFFATASAVALAGGKPRFCDVDDAGMMDVAHAAKRLTAHTRGLAPVHLYGNACDVAGLQQLARERGLHLVWDAAQAHGTQMGGQDVGGLGDVVCYSFYPTKTMTTGEGGMVTTNVAALAQRLRLLRNHGQTERYSHAVLGLNYRMTDVQAAIGLVQLRHLRSWLDKRQSNARLLDSLLAGIPGIRTPAVRQGVRHSYHQYTIQVVPKLLGLTRDELAARLGACGVETAVHYPTPLHRQPVFAREHGQERFPVSETLAETVLSLPVHQSLDEGEIRAVAAAVSDVARGASAQDARKGARS